MSSENCIYGYERGSPREVFYFAKFSKIFFLWKLKFLVTGSFSFETNIYMIFSHAAGVFLIARCSHIYEHISDVLEYMVIVGALTSFFAATSGLLQNDIKRVIAYSTCSQLGYMVFACGLSNYSVSFFHLVNHAFFKALLFLSAGSVIHAVNDEQDMRKMGGLKKLAPFTYSMIVIGSLALIGFPFLTGFYSKDLILEVAYGTYSLLGHFSYYLGTFGAFLTAFYSMRLSYLVFLSIPTGHRQVICFAYDSGFQICVALGCLAIPSILIGYYVKDMFVGVGSNFFGTAIYVNSENFNIFDAEFVDVFYKILPVNLSLIGFFFSYVLYNFKSKFLFKIKTSTFGKKIYYFLNRKWFFDKIYKCGVLIPQFPGLLRFTVQSATLNQTMPIFLGVKQLFLVIFFCSIGKRIFRMASLYFGASKILVKLFPTPLNNLHYKMVRHEVFLFISVNSAINDVTLIFYSCLCLQ